jgi:hypothetical protein
MKALKERIDTELAYLEGKSIQYRLSDGSWRDCIGEPSFQWHANEYRIKPEEPLVMYPALYRSGTGEIYKSAQLFSCEEDAKRVFTNCLGLVQSEPVEIPELCTPEDNSNDYWEDPDGGK